MGANTDISDHVATLPLDAWHRGKGARMVSFAGYDMPIQYDGIIAEHCWTRGSAGLFDVSHMGQLMLSGDGAEAALEALMPGDFAALTDGRMRYSMLLTDDGGIIDDCMVTRCPMGFYVVVNGATKKGDIAHIEARLPGGVTLNHMTDRALIALQGPKAAEVLASVVPGVGRLVFMSADSFLWDEHPLWVSRSGYTGEDGFEISLPADIVEAFADALLTDERVKPIGLGARDSLRLEAGLPLYGHDIDLQTSPVAADLGFAISRRRREEGGFPGADAIIAERKAGAALKRVGLLIEGRQPVREGSLVVGDDGNDVGRVTSGGFSPSLEAPIAMAYVPAALAQPGTQVTLSQRGRNFMGTITPMPFVPHRYVRKGSAA